LQIVFKKELLEGEHNFKASTGDVFKLALYTSTATLNSATTVYTTTAEVSASGQYTAGGGTLVNSGTSLVSGVAFCDFANLSFTGVTLTARGALIYNTSATVANAAVAVLDFTADKNSYRRNLHNYIPSGYKFSSYSKNIWLIGTSYHGMGNEYMGHRQLGR
jgi:hypothetical protein